MNKIPFWLGVLLVVALIGGAAYLSLFNKGNADLQTQTPLLDTGVSSELNLIPAETPSSIAPSLFETWVTVAWEPQLVVRDNPSCDPERSEYYCPVKSYLVGTLQDGPYAGKELFLGGIEGMGIYYEYYILDNGVIIFFSEKKIGVRGVNDLPDMVLFTPKPGYSLKKGYISSQFFSELQLGEKVFTDPTLGDIYIETKGGCFVIELPDHRTITYELDMPFVNEENGTLSVTFTTGESVSAEAYEFTVIRGCGALCRYLHVVDEKSVVPAERFIIVGTTSNGEHLYGIKNKEDAGLKEVYDDKSTMAYYAAGYEKLSVNKYTYEQFLSFQPLLYWKDPLGRWIEFKNTRFIVAAEMCKPVIYLYPEEITNVTVTVEPNGGITYSEPPYQNGWNVQAHPNGVIYDFGSGKEVPYLFWEGIGLNYPPTDKGWVVAQKDLPKFFSDKLAVLGLRGREQVDFISYWTDRLVAKPYYKISFLTKAQFDELAPLDLSHPVQNVIRVMMTVKELDAPFVIEPQELDVPAERRGFTVVEWGGVVLR